MFKMKNKRGREDLLYGVIIFLILDLIVILAAFLYAARAGTGASVKEQAYSKQIALLIDQAKPGTNLTIDISELYEMAEKNKYTGEIVKIDNQDINVILDKGKGYSFKHFNSAVVTWGDNQEDKKLYVQVK